MKILYPYCILLIIIACYSCASSGTKSPAADSTQAVTETAIPAGNEPDRDIQEPSPVHMPLDSIIYALDPNYAKKELKAFVHHYNDTTETVFIEDSLKDISCKLYFLSNLAQIDDTLQPADANNMLPGIKEKKAVLLINGENIPWETDIDDLDMMIPGTLRSFNYHGEHCLLLSLDHISLTTVGSYPAYLLLIMNDQEQVVSQQRISEPWTPEGLKDYLSLEYRGMQQIVYYFKSKNIDAIVDHAGFPFSLSAGEASGGADIKDAGALKARLKKLFASGFLDEFFKARGDVNMENHSISYIIHGHDENDAWESAIILSFRTTKSGKIELYQIGQAG